MAYTKQNFYKNQTLKAEHLNNIEDGIVAIETELANVHNQKLNILFIGNSLTQDSVSYLPLLLDEIAPEINYTIYDWYNGGRKLSEHYDRFIANTPCEMFGTITNNQAGGWNVERNTVTMNWVCKNCDFDIVVLQEYSYYDFSDEVEVTNFNNVVNYLRANYDKPFKVYSYIDAPMRTRVENDYAKAKKYAKLHITNSMSEGLINPGTAVVYGIQDPMLNTLGDNGLLTSDGTHTQEGLPCMLQSYVLALWVFDQLGIPKSILNSKTRMTTDLYNSWQSFGPNLGSGVVEGTTAQYKRAQEIAIKAYKYGKQLLNSCINALTDDAGTGSGAGEDAGTGSGADEASDKEIVVSGAMLGTNIAVGSEYTTTSSQYTTSYDVYKVPVAENTIYTVAVRYGLYSGEGKQNLPAIAICDENDIVLEVILAQQNVATMRTETFTINTADYPDAASIIVAVYNNSLSVTA